MSTTSKHPGLFGDNTKPLNSTTDPKSSSSTNSSPKSSSTSSDLIDLTTDLKIKPTPGKLEREDALPKISNRFITDEYGNTITNNRTGGKSTWSAPVEKRPGVPTIANEALAKSRWAPGKGRWEGDEGYKGSAWEKKEKGNGRRRK